MKSKLLLIPILMAMTAPVIGQTTIFTEDFESGSLPAGWTRSQNTPSVGWEFGTNSQLQSQPYFPIPAHTKFACSNDDKYDVEAATQNLANLDFLITPALDFSSYGSIFLEFRTFFHGNYGSKAFIKVSSDGGTTWDLNLELTPQTGWHTNLLNISLPATAPKNNVKVCFHHDDNNGWGSGFAIDDVKIFEPISYDVSGLRASMRSYELKQATNIQGVLRNLGGATINSLDLNYQIDNGPIVTQNIGSLNINPLTNYNFTHPTPWTPVNAGKYAIKIWASNINGNSDQNPNNDEITHSLYISNTLEPKQVLYEQFTSNTCAPCAASAPTITSYLEGNNVNGEGTSLNAIKYHLNFPTAGDPAYNSESQARQTYYSVNSIPRAIINGINYNGHPLATSGGNQVVPGIVDGEATRGTLFDLNVSATYKGDTVMIEGDYTPTVDMNENLKLHVVIIENNIPKDSLAKYQGSPGTGITSQTEFKQVMRKMLPSSSGASMGTQTTGTKKEFDYSYVFQNNNPRIFNKVSDLTVVAFIQNETTKEIFQSKATNVPLNTVGVNELNKLQVSALLYPNPANRNAQLSFYLPSPESVSVEVYNLMGALVYANEIGTLSLGKHNHIINSEAYPSGIYIVNLKTGNTITTQKLSIQH